MTADRNWLDRLVPRSKAEAIRYRAAHDKAPADVSVIRNRPLQERDWATLTEQVASAACDRLPSDLPGADDAVTRWVQGSLTARLADLMAREGKVDGFEQAMQVLDEVMADYPGVAGPLAYAAGVPADEFVTFGDVQPGSLMWSRLTVLAGLRAPTGPVETVDVEKPTGGAR